MEKIEFKNLPSKETPISAENLNQMQDDIEESIEGTVLYESQEGTISDISLNESSANFKYLEIFFFDDHSLCKSEKIFNPNGKRASLSTFNVYAKSGTVFANSRIIKISGTSISNDTEGDGYGQWISWNNTINATNNIKIYKIVGYK